jgi:hypothetical protein
MSIVSLGEEGLLPSAIIILCLFAEMLQQERHRRGFGALVALSTPKTRSKVFRIPFEKLPFFRTGDTWQGNLLGFMQGEGSISFATTMPAPAFDAAKLRLASTPRSRMLFPFTRSGLLRLYLEVTLLRARPRPRWAHHNRTLSSSSIP